MSIVVRIATEMDLLPIQRLVAKAGLTDQGIEQQIKDFLVVENDQKKIIGTVGIERIGMDGLLRSLVMASESWNAKIGLDFLELALAFAKQQGVQNLYLLTNKSVPFFEHLGFEEIDEDDIPSGVKASKHFDQYVAGVTKVMGCSLVTVTNE